MAGLVVGPVRLDPGGALAEALSALPGVELDSGLSPVQAAVVADIRLPRVVLGMLVGATLAICGAAYQGVFRNPLADPYLLGAAAGAGLGVTLAIGWGLSGVVGPAGPLIPLFAFLGALVAVALSYFVGAAGDQRRSSSSLLLAGVAVASLLTAAQTFVQQRYVDTIQEVYSWILGRLSTAGWAEVVRVAPYAVIASAVILLHRRVLDLMTVGDDEAGSLGLHVGRSRLIVVAAASLGTAAAVSAAGLIGFVGIIVPHALRLFGVTSYRWLLGLSAVLGGAFLVLADLVARQALAPAEVPIGVVTAVIGAPAFVLLLRARQRIPAL
jgi:iron complex transport system permease protein